MTSQINPADIDGNYPIAGVSNNTQGMRDNFTNTRTNFQYAADEITDLQNKAVLKAALTGTTLDNNLANNIVYNAQIKGISGTTVAIANTSGTITIDCSAAHYQSIVMAGNIALSFTSNTWPASGTLGMVRTQITVDQAGRTLSLPTQVSNGLVGIQGYSSNVITFAQAGTYEFGFLTTSAGNSITIFDLNRPLSYYTNDVTVQGNLTVNGDIFGNVTLTDITVGNVTATGNVQAGNLRTTGIVSAAGNITGGNLVTTGQANVATLSVTGAVTFSTLTSDINIGTSATTGNISIGGSGTAGTGFINIGGSTATRSLYIGNGATSTGNTKTLSVGENGTSGSTTTINVGPATAGTAAGLVTFNTATRVAIANTGASALSVAGNITGGNINSGGAFSATGNITGGNLITGGAFSAASISISGASQAASYSASGNITGGNLVTGGAVSAVSVSASGTSQAASYSATGNVTGGNLVTTGQANVATLSVTGAVTMSATTQDISIGGSLTTGNVILGGSGVQTGFIAIGGTTATRTLFLANGVTGTGNTKTISFGENGASGSTTNINIGPATATATGTATFNTATRVAIANTSGTALSVAGNIVGGNVSATALTGTTVSVSGNITGGNVLGGANVNATTHTGTTVSVTGNITGGNLNAAGLSLSSNVVSALNVTANIAGGNITTPGLISATGAISSASFIRSSSNTAGVGYAAGAGGTVTQGTNRATGVTLNAVTGNIVLFNVAGNTTPTTFTLTNSAIANTDVLILNQRSGTNLYILLVTAVGTGTANITVYTTGGVTAEAPVINFAVIKGVTA